MKTSVGEIIKAIPKIDSQDMVLIAIDGCGGAGKSTIANHLAAELENSQVVHVDDFYKSKEHRVEVTEQTPVHINFEFDRLKEQVIEPLKRNDVAKFLDVDGEAKEIMPSGYIIVEGLGTLGNELKTYFDYKIWVDAIDVVRRHRGIERDTDEWTEIWDKDYLPQDARYMMEQAPQKEADLVIQNN